VLQNLAEVTARDLEVDQVVLEEKRHGRDEPSVLNRILVRRADRDEEAQRLAVSPDCFDDFRIRRLVVEESDPVGAPDDPRLLQDTPSRLRRV